MLVGVAAGGEHHADQAAIAVADHCGPLGTALCGIGEDVGDDPVGHAGLAILSQCIAAEAVDLDQQHLPVLGKIGGDSVPDLAGAGQAGDEIERFAARLGLTEGDDRDVRHPLFGGGCGGLGVAGRGGERQGGEGHQCDQAEHAQSSFEGLMKMSSIVIPNRSAILKASGSEGS
jgi:hypothetical protein